MTNGWNNSFVFDALGRQVQENAPLGTVARTFDAAGRMTSETLPGGGLAVNYDYDVTGNTIAVRENGATTGVGVLATYSYDNLGRRSSVVFGNGTSQSYTYDPVSRLSSLAGSIPANCGEFGVGAINENDPMITITAPTYVFRSGANLGWIRSGAFSSCEEPRIDCRLPDQIIFEDTIPFIKDEVEILVDPLVDLIDFIGNCIGGRSSVNWNKAAREANYGAGRGMVSGGARGFVVGSFGGPAGTAAGAAGGAMVGSVGGAVMSGGGSVIIQACSAGN